MKYRRRYMTREEFDARCARLEELCPYLSATSGVRELDRNRQVGGHPESKHLRWNDRESSSGHAGIPHVGARDYVVNQAEAIDDFDGELSFEEIEARLIDIAKTLGLWAVNHDNGSGIHLHVQGEAPGGWSFKGDGW